MPPLVRLLDRAIGLVCLIAAGLAALLLLVSLGLVGYSVVMRYFMNRPIPWVDELVGYLLVLAPQVGSILNEAVQAFDPASVTIGLIRYPAAAGILLAALFLAHVVLPARRTRFANIWPGVLLTLALWAILAAVFSFYLRNFASYGSYYGGLAGIIAALYFMYLAALVLIFGGEFNRALRIRRLARAMRKRAGQVDDSARP